MNRPGQNRRQNRRDDDAELDADAGGRLVAVVVVAEREDVEALPVGAAHAALHPAAERLGVERRAASHRHVAAAH